MHWLAVERYDNWLADKNRGFSFLGISEKKLKLASNIRPKDLIIIYVSSCRSSFAGVLEVLSDKPRRATLRLAYDEPFPYQIDTKPVLLLAEESWIRIHDLIGELSFLPKDKQWRQLMRNALRPLNDRDAHAIIARINLAKAENGRSMNF